MRLSDLLDMTRLPDGVDGATEILGLTADSRNVSPGYLFAALPGAVADGAKYTSDALKNGARLVLARQGVALPDVTAPVLRDDNPRRQLALLAGRFFKFMPPHISAVTGTNGKTSVAEFTRQIWQQAGYQAASMGTLGVQADNYSLDIGHTTPDPVMLHAVLRDLYFLNIQRLTMEASSHGLAQYRMDAVPVNVAGFTNISRDHLDYHASERDYFDAKMRLFTDLLSPSGVAVINLCGAGGKEVEQTVAAAGIKTLTISYADADSDADADANMVIDNLRTDIDGLHFTLAYQGKEISLKQNIAGAFQAENLAVAAAMCLADGLPWNKLAKACAKQLTAPRGRMEQVGMTASGAAAYVDYAHTPDALENALTALRPHCGEDAGRGGRLICVFGCGGDRDAGKRPKMGEVAARLADTIIITDDNPRHEAAAEIRAAILAACPAADEIGDREVAIEAAVALAGAGDIILVAGKGHETGQVTGEHVLPFSDQDVLRKILASPDSQGGAA